MTLFGIPTFESLKDSVKAYWRTIRSNADTGPGSDVDLFSHALAHIGDGLHKHILNVKRLLFPSTSFGTELNEWLFALGQPDGQNGYGLIQAAGSYGTDALQVTCTAGTPTINTTHYLQDTAGRRYRINETYAFSGPGTANVDIIAITKSAATNLEAGEVLTFENPPAGIQATATLVSDLDYGRDLMTTTEGRTAVVTWLRAPNMSGNWPEWRRTTDKASPGILDIFVWNGRNNYPFGYATTDIALLQVGESGVNRIVTSAQESAVLAYLQANTPYLSLKQMRIFGQGGLAAPHTGTVSPVHKTIEVDFKLGEGAPPSKECSWNAQSEKRYVNAQTPGSKLIEVNAVYTTGPQSGETIFIDGYEATVDLEPGNASAPVSGSMAKFTVTTWPWSVDISSGRPSGNGFYVMSGGGLIADAWQAVRDHVDAIGPAKGPAASPQAGWEDNLRPDLIKAEVARASEGYIVAFPLCQVDGGSVDVAPTYDTISTIELLIDDGIAIWEDKS